MGRKRSNPEKNLRAHYVPEENRWVLLEEEEEAPKFNYAPRTFDQKGVLHTSEEASVRLTRAYNLEPMIAISDRQLKFGAQERGQDLGAASRNSHIKDLPPES